MKKLLYLCVVLALVVVINLAFAATKCNANNPQPTKKPIATIVANGYKQCGHNGLPGTVATEPSVAYVLFSDGSVDIYNETNAVLPFTKAQATVLLKAQLSDKAAVIIANGYRQIGHNGIKGTVAASPSVAYVLTSNGSVKVYNETKATLPFTLAQATVLLKAQLDKKRAK